MGGSVAKILDESTMSGVVRFRWDSNGYSRQSDMHERMWDLQTLRKNESRDIRRMLTLPLQSFSLSKGHGRLFALRIFKTGTAEKKHRR